jgi:hypothetical protein
MLKIRTTSPLKYHFLRKIIFTMCFLLNLFFLLSLIIIIVYYFIISKFVKSLTSVFKLVRMLMLIPKRNFHQNC